jgi:hypothetical protein
MPTKGELQRSVSSTLLRRTRLISDKVASSSTVSESIRTYEQAPIPIKKIIEMIKRDEYSRISDMLLITMSESVEEPSLDKLATVAAVERIRSSPTYVRIARKILDEESPKHILEFTSWVNKNLSSAALNLIRLLNDESKLIFVRPDEKKEASELPFESQAEELDFAVRTVGSKRKVLIAIGKSEKEIETILGRDAKRINTNVANGVVTDPQDVQIWRYMYFLAILRNSEKQVTQYFTSEN